MILHHELRTMIFSPRVKRAGVWLQSRLHTLSQRAYPLGECVYWGTLQSLSELSTKIFLTIFLRAGYEIMHRKEDPGGVTSLPITETRISCFKTGRLLCI